MSEAPDQSVDEMIMLYADGLLPAGQRPAARAHLATDTDAMDRFEAYLFTRDPLAQPFDDVLSAPIPERLLRAVYETAMPQTPPRRAPVMSGQSAFARLVDLFRMPAFSPAVAIPAVLMAVAGGWLASHALRSDIVSLEDRGYVASAALQQALERTPSKASATLVDGVTFKPTLTFASNQQTWCRQFVLDYDAATLRDGGLACRTRNSTWRVIAATGPAQPSAESGSGGYAPAGEIGIIAKTRSEIRSRRLPLESGEVGQLIEKGWTRP